MWKRLIPNLGGKSEFGETQRRAKSSENVLSFGSLVLLAALSACSPSASAAPTTGGGSVSAAAATAAPAATSASPSAACANPLYPVVASAVWNYHVSGSPTGDFDFTSTIKSVNPDGFVEESAFPELVKDATWKCDPAGLVLLSPGGGVSGTISTSSLNANYTTTGSSGVTLPKSVAAGDAWTQTLNLHGENKLSDGTVVPTDATDASSFKAVGMESVTVPAGTFQAMRIDVTTVFSIETNVSGVSVPIQLNITGSVWYAPGIGMVRTVSTVEGIATTTVLTSYTIP